MNLNVAKNILNEKGYLLELTDPYLDSMDDELDNLIRNNDLFDIICDLVEKEFNIHLIKSDVSAYYNEKINDNVIICVKIKKYPDNIQISTFKKESNRIKDFNSDNIYYDYTDAYIRRSIRELNTHYQKLLNTKKKFNWMFMKK